MAPQSRTEPAPGTSQAWIPELEGDTLTGTVQEVIDAWSDQRNGFYPLLIVVDEDGIPRALHAFTAVLYAEVLRKRPMPGDQVEVTYLGLSANSKPGQNPAKRYRVKVPGREGEQARMAYDRLGGERDQLPTPAPEPDVPIDTADLDEAPF